MNRLGSFSIDVAKRILEILNLNSSMKRTRLAKKAGLQYNVCTRYLGLLNAVEWIRMNPDVSLTESGKWIRDKLANPSLPSHESIDETTHGHQQAGSKFQNPILHSVQLGLVGVENQDTREKRKCPKVILVDDDRDVAITLEAFLKGKYETKVYTNSPEALREFATSPYDTDLVVLDVRMPLMNGFQLYQSMKAIDTHCRFLFVSALEDVCEISSIFPEIQPQDILKKPIHRDVFNRAVLNALSTGHNERHQLRHYHLGSVVSGIWATVGTLVSLFSDDGLPILLN